MKIAIAGYGIEGKSNYEYYRAQSYTEELVIFDERKNLELPVGARAVLGPEAFEKIPSDYMVIRTSGLPEEKIKSGGKIWTGTNEFFVRCPARIIGVTGSKGKGTTASFIASILRAGGHRVHLLGNIGVPSLTVLPKIKETDIVVFELSSFQLRDAVYSPQIAVITNIEPDHLNVHGEMSDYINSKAHIVKYQKTEDMVVFNQTDKAVKQMVKSAVAEQKPFPSLKFAHVRAGVFYYGKRPIGPTAAVRLPGYHNLLNAMAAINATYDLIIGNAQAIIGGLNSFRGLPHRLNLVRIVNGVSYYDDSIATTPGSVTAAIHSFACPKVLILGGADKGADYRALACEIANKRSRVKAVIAIGENRSKIIFELRRCKYDNIYEVASTKMEDIVGAAKNVAEPGDVVIMSPAAASFDMFKSYSDRGDKFIHAVGKL